MKFKEGDLIKCIKRKYGNETIGQIYSCRACDTIWVYIYKDDNGERNCYDIDQFILAEKAKVEPLKRLPKWF